MSDYETMCSQANLKRAYRWLLSNPDARYKNLFRDSYAAFAIASNRNLTRIRDDLRHNRYEANHAGKIYLPKPSGVLRPITLLTVNDQVVYQACVNVVADKLKPITKHRYRKRVFNHLYAGKSSKFFYLKWQPSYHLFSDSIRDTFNKGYQWVANFDLASFYDSIDHNVLKHFLIETGVDDDLIKYLMRCLKIWSSSTWSNRSNVIYHEHGIPQGPLSSGMLSEVVLKHIDETGERGRRTKYFRYVDDIKLFSKTENYLRQKLIALDLCSKEIGLFPQTSKINIRRLKNPEDEIKSVSIPPEPSIGPFGNQTKLVKRLLEITRRGRVDQEHTSRFKFLLGHADPTHKLNARLLGVLANHPEFAEAISTYFSKFDKLPHKAAKEILGFIRGEEYYHFVHGCMLRAVLYNVQEPERSRFTNFCYERLFRNPPHRLWALEPQPTYKEALIAWVMHTHIVSFAELERLRVEEQDWWVRKSILRELDIGHFGRPSYESFLNECMHISESEISRCAASAIVTQGLSVRSPYGRASIAAKECLKAGGLIRYVGRPRSYVETVLTYVLRLSSTTYDWRRLLGPTLHKDAEQLAVIIKQGFEADIDACLVRMDSLK